MTRGGSSVMASKNVAPANALNFFPTPPWAVRALLYHVLRVHFGLTEGQSAWEPACGAGHCAIPLHEIFARVFASDVHDWGFGAARNLDFSLCTAAMAPWPIDWVITNPPFTLADVFAMRGLAIARCGVAMLVRLQWLEGGDRYANFYAPGAPFRPNLICVFAERVPMIEAAWDPEASSATAYAWIVWDPANPLPADQPFIPTYHFPPGMQERFTLPVDEALTNRGEAARRLAAKKAAARPAP